MAGSRKERERQQRREMLLEAASRVFGRKPFDEATMQEVAAEAQIGMQGLYEQFPSKQALYEQVILDRALAFQARMRTILDRDLPPLEALRRVALAYAEQFRERPMHLPMFIRDRVHFDWGFDSRFAPRLREVYESERTHLRALMVRAIQTGQIRALDPDYLAQLCFNVLEASLHHSHRREPGESSEISVDRALDCFLAGAGAAR
jgi:AcrR family transcriptional regulator